jgi:hypothetical protein
VQIVGSIFLHSLLYGKRSVDALKKTPYYDMGSKVSHGCVRLYVEDAKWLYNYACPGTTVEITADEPSNREMRKALKSKMSFSEYNAFQKTILDEAEELPNKRAWVTVPGARMRKGSGSSFDSVARLAVGDELEVLLESEVWVKVRFRNKEGYVLRGYISYDQSAPDTKEDADILKTTEWLYATPDDDGDRICKMRPAFPLKVLETTRTAGRSCSTRTKRDTSALRV